MIDFKSLELNIPDMCIDSAELMRIVMARRNDLMQELIHAINHLAQNDPLKVEQIVNAYKWSMYRDYVREAEKNGEVVDLDGYEIPSMPSTIENYLSFALLFLQYQINAIESGDFEKILGWQFMAFELYGKAVGCAQTEDIQDFEKSAFYKAAAKKRHTENHAIKADALKYYAENIQNFTSKDNAAEKIAGKIVNAKFRTVRQWITEYHKNQRSAGTT